MLQQCLSDKYKQKISRQAQSQEPVPAEIFSFYAVGIKIAYFSDKPYFKLQPI